MLIREATADDWADIYPFWSQIMDAGATYAAEPGRTLEQGRGDWMTGPPGVTLVAEVDGRIVGSAKLGPNRPGPGAHVATASFVVDPEHHGGGVGRALATAVLDRAQADGYRAMQFNAVVETNRAAVHLWQSLGFEIIGTVPEAFDHPTDGLVGLHIMYRRL